MGPSERTEPISTLYIAVPSPFPLLETFIEQAARDYNLELHYCRPPDDVTDTPVVPASNSESDRCTAAEKAKVGIGMRQALEVYKAQFPRIEAILIGIRRSDPHGGDVVIVQACINHFT